MTTVGAKAWSKLGSQIALVTALACGQSSPGGTGTEGAEGTGGDCPVGAETCPCTAGGSCDPGLECRSDRCVDPGGDGGADESADDGGDGASASSGGSDGTTTGPSGTSGLDDTGGETSVSTSGASTSSGGSTSSGSSSSSSSGSSSSSSSSSSSTGGGGSCGDGFVDPGESCDDGDQVNGNGCNNDCQPSGRELWTERYDGPDSLDDEAFGVAVDAGGGILVVGYVGTATAGQDALVRKYTSDGQFEWERTSNGSDSLDDQLWGAAFDSTGAFVVSGYSDTVLEDKNVWTRKYNPAGQEIWTRVFHQRDDWAFGLAIDSADNPIPCGYASRPMIGGFEALVVKYDPSGMVDWSRTFDGGGNGGACRGVATDSLDNVIISGGMSVGTKSRFIRKYSPSGQEAWTQHLDGTGQAAWDVTVNAADEILAVGADDMGMWLGKFASDGLAAWQRWPSPTGNANGVVIDSTGSIIMAGQRPAGSRTDSVVVKYAANGDLYWMRTSVGGGSGAWAYSVDVDAADNVVVAGHEVWGSQGLNIWIRKYSP